MRVVHMTIVDVKDPPALVDGLVRLVHKLEPSAHVVTTLEEDSA